MVPFFVLIVGIISIKRHQAFSSRRLLIIVGPIVVVSRGCAEHVLLELGLERLWRVAVGIILVLEHTVRDWRPIPHGYLFESQGGFIKSLAAVRQGPRSIKESGVQEVIFLLRVAGQPQEARFSIVGASLADLLWLEGQVR